ncbi:hypothetical protein CFOL_v3_05157 [Cephalotus follicularis]|uniref:Uncharacterized protein n=1 Tax=Cephalotus follicularis TaxID=3775 RepID=A0A1Q3B0Z6_CEPFO|nr:hypothetical protein CFOL_v3_05157 [Cephalotus follicularis]
MNVDARILGQLYNFMDRKITSIIFYLDNVKEDCSLSMGLLNLKFRLVLRSHPYKMHSLVFFDMLLMCLHPLPLQTLLIGLFWLVKIPLTAVVGSNGCGGRGVRPPCTHCGREGHY